MRSPSDLSTRSDRFLLAAYISMSLFLFLAGCDSTDPSSVIGQITLATNSSQSLIATIQHADQIFVYEGLPHPTREQKLFNKELQRSDVRRIAGFPFYSSKFTTNGKQTAKLKAAIGDVKMYDKRTGEPLDCGPFHPDFAISWVHKTKQYHALFCFTCNQVRVFGEGRQQGRNIANQVAFKSLLYQFSHHRPDAHLPE